MTEDEARTKWCPQALVSTGDGSFNRGALPPGSENVTAAITLTRCIASDCMMWRAREMRMGAPGEPDAHVVPGGRCGLAGGD